MKITSIGKVAFFTPVPEIVEDYWTCLCGNTPSEYGFYPCNTKGEMVEPTPQEWTTNWYVCDQCGRIIDQNTLEVVGVRHNNTLTPEEREAIFTQA